MSTVILDRLLQRVREAEVQVSLLSAKITELQGRAAYAENLALALQGWLAKLGYPREPNILDRLTQEIPQRPIR